MTVPRLLTTTVTLDYRIIDLAGKASLAWSGGKKVPKSDRNTIFFILVAFAMSKCGFLHFVSFRPESYIIGGKIPKITTVFSLIEVAASIFYSKIFAAARIRIGLLLE